MSTKRKSKSDAERVFNGFVSCELDQETKVAAREWVRSQSDWWEHVLKLVDSGYKVSFSVDRYNDTHQCSLTCSDEASPNYGWCLVGRGPDPDSALGMACYKHYFVLSETWGETASHRQRDEWG